MKFSGKLKTKMFHGIRQASTKSLSCARRLLAEMLVSVGIHMRVRITGHSMWPVINDGDVVYVRKKSSYKKNDIVLLAHPYKKMYLFKRIDGTTDTQVYVVGMNDTETQDSRTFGWIHKQAVLGTLIRKVDQ